MSRKIKRKKVTRVHLGSEGMSELQKFQRDLVAGLPAIDEMTSAAMGVFKALAEAPSWRIAETEKPEAMADRMQEAMSIGHAKVNYVDKIERTNYEGTQ